MQQLWLRLIKYAAIFLENLGNKQKHVRGAQTVIKKFYFSNSKLVFPV